MNDLIDQLRSREPPRRGSGKSWAATWLPHTTLTGDTEIDLRAILLSVWRRKYIVIASVILITGLTWLQLRQITPTYVAHAKLLIETREANVADLESVFASIEGDPTSVEGELEVLRSRPLIERVIRDLELATHQEFDPDAESSRTLLSYLNPLTYIPDSWQWTIDGTRGDRVLSEEEKLEQNRVAVTDRFLERLEAEVLERSRVISVSFESESPRRAAEIANEVANAYVTNTLEVKYQATAQASSWLNERMADLREAVETSEQAVERYRASAGLTEGRGSSLILEQTSGLSSELIVAQAETARAEARLRQVEGRGGSAGVSEVLSSPLIQGLRQQEAQLQREAAELGTEFGEKHPRMVNMRAQISDLRSKISVEIAKIVDALRNEVQVARAKEASLRASLGALNTEAATLNEAEVELRALQREADANRLLLENFLGRFKETSVQSDLQQPDARVISRAEPPLGPSYPRSMLILGIAFVGSVAVGLGLVYAAELLDAGVRKSDDLEQITGLPVLGTIPTVPRWSWSKGRPRVDTEMHPEDQILDRPGSVFSEAVRSLHLNLTWTHADKVPKVIVVTSPLPGEGKSSLSMALARARARSGDSVLLLDCDFRRPAVADALGLNPEPGLSDFLFGRAELKDVVQTDEESGCRITTAGHATTNPVDLVESKAMREALKVLRDQYDLILIDTSPVLAVSEPRQLAMLADTTVLLVRWGKTPKDVVRSAIKTLVDIGAPVAGTVLAQVNLKRQASYGYGQYGHYSRRAQGYYTG